MKYIAKPVEVDAFTIVQVGDADNDGSVYIEVEAVTHCVKVTREMLARMKPKPGDYWVQQSDGYVYLNPRDVFLRKYRPIEGT